MKKKSCLVSCSAWVEQLVGKICRQRVSVPAIALAVLALSLLIQSACQAAPPYKIGVFYFPGWKDDASGLMYKKPWEPIKAFPDRQPLLGWYSEGDVKVAEQQVDWMHKYGIDYVVYDWYWSPENTVLLNHAVDAFMRAKNTQDTHFSILWANHTELPKSKEQFDSMVSYWVATYFKSERFLKIEGKPVVFVFDVDNLRRITLQLGITTKDLFADAQEIARTAGFPGIYFIGCIEYESKGLEDYARNNGYAAVSAYNFHAAHGELNLSHSYVELDADYRSHWEWVAQNSSLPMIVPMTAGWSRAPWGGSKDPEHDNSLGTAEMFKAHLQAAKEFMSLHNEQTQSMGVICCWNEYGEGSFIEPTQSKKFEYLERVREVFAK